MEKTIPGAFAVIGGTILGAAVSWGIFYFAASWLDAGGPFDPVTRATHFAATFGIGGGAFIGFEQARKMMDGDGGSALILPGILMVAIWGFAVYTLFFLNAWQVIFSGGFAAFTIVILLWLVIVGWISRALGGSFNPFKS